MRRCEVLTASVAVLLATAWSAEPKRPGGKPPPVNLAPKAKVTADSVHSDKYLGRLAVNGVIPPAMCKADIGKAWAVNGSTHRQGAELTLEWAQPVLVAEIVYYGRTAWEWEENWKDYEVYRDGESKPVAKGRLQRGHGPQRIKLPAPALAGTIRLKFLSSYGGSNPGASEIRVYSVSPPQKLLGKFSKPTRRGGRPKLPVREIPASPELEAQLKAGRLGFDRMLVVERHATGPTHVYTYHCEGFRPGGGLYVYTPADGKLERIVDSPDGQIIDHDLSYDGRTLLFSWKTNAKEAFQVYRLDLTGPAAEPVRLTEGPHHNYNACWLPDGGVAFLSTRDPQFAYCWTSPVGVLYRMAADGSKPLRLSANYLNDFTPAVLNDGRIIYGRWEYVDRPAIPIQSLWAINPDGTKLSIYYGNRVLSPATFIEARPIPESDSVICTLTAHNGPCRGAIGIIDRIHGVNAQESIRNLTSEIDIGQVDRGSGNHVRGPYENPYPLGGELFLVSRAGTVLLRDFDGTKQVTVLEPRGRMGFYSPQPIRPRPAPPAQPSTLPKTPDRWATLYLQDVYNGLEPHVRRGQVKQIRVVQEIEKGKLAQVSRRAFGFQFPVVSCGATYAPKKVWGHVKVHEDGSAAFRVPANVPIYFMALDEHGRALQRMRSFTHLMPGESQGCVGCHERRDQTSHLRDHPMALGLPVQDLEPPEWGAVGFSYAHVVQPIFDRHCVGCHKAVAPAGGLELTGDATDYFNVSYEQLARNGSPGSNPYTKWIPTYNGREANILLIEPNHWGSPASKLAEIVLTGHPGNKAPRPRFKLTDAERRRVFAWIDLNVPYYGTSLSNHYDRRGCRQMIPPQFDKVFSEVAARRCAGCHKGSKGKASVPRKPWLRIANPQLNAFMLAPLARSAGGTERCGRAVFASTDDADYQAILKTFEPIHELLRQTPRMDMTAEPPAHPNPQSCPTDAGEDRP